MTKFESDVGYRGSRPVDNDKTSCKGYWIVLWRRRRFSPPRKNVKECRTNYDEKGSTAYCPPSRVTA